MGQARSPAQAEVAQHRSALSEDASPPAAARPGANGCLGSPDAGAAPRRQGAIQGLEAAAARATAGRPREVAGISAIAPGKTTGIGDSAGAIPSRAASGWPYRRQGYAGRFGGATLATLGDCSLHDDARSPAAGVNKRAGVARRLAATL